MPREGSLTIRTIGQRPDPPEGMDGVGERVWREVVSAMPAGYFTSETIAMLTMYCRHVAAWAHIDEIIEELWRKPDADATEVRRWLAARRDESKGAGDVATKLRLTPQAKWDKNKRISSAPSGPPPWEQ